MSRLPLLDQDPLLVPYEDKLVLRHQRYLDKLSEINASFGSLLEMADGHHYFGFNQGELGSKTGWWYREWAPGALSLALIGDFNSWERFRTPMKKNQFGVWEVFIDTDRYPEFGKGSKVKVNVVSKNGTTSDRLPAYLKRVVTDGSESDFVGLVWDSDDFVWQHEQPKRPENLRIYESHVGIAQEEGKVGTYNEFREQVLPRIKKAGYTTVQLMAVQQHPYYASFGYQVSSFFSPSHYFGTPEELKQLIDEAHGLGLAVFLDVIHSHAVKNILDGLNEFDGTSYQYFHAGAKGDHPAWDTKLFNYDKVEVLRFLLSNVRYWLEEFKFDGFRFDGVTSMLYQDHGLGKSFDHYDRYFDDNVDYEAITYLTLANDLAHQLNPQAVTIAEDVSGLPGMATPIADGGLGFDYRLSMGVPDYWIKLLKHVPDEDWSMREIYHTLINRRWNEAHVGYSESHDQALVGDKTIAFWLMDQEMYTGMSKDCSSPVIDRGIALHKLIRALTFALSGEAYLNFMGNEFGHPEWIDFPREGNNYSHHYARRQWSLMDNPQLRYRELAEFDRAMMRLDDQFNLLPDKFIEKISESEEQKLLVFRRGPLMFVFNFHGSESYEGLQIGVPDEGDYSVVLSSDEVEYGGFGRVKSGQVYPYLNQAWDDRPGSVKIYSPSRTVQVLSPVPNPKS